MKRQRLQAAALGGSPDEVEQAFYEALNQGDLDRLMACWAEEDEVVCVHPGSPRLMGHSAIRSTFEALCAQGAVQVRTGQIHRIDALACSVHVLTEQLAVPGRAAAQAAWVTVTHVFHKTPHGWRLVARHVSPARPQDHPDLVQRPSVLH